MKRSRLESPGGCFSGIFLGDYLISNPWECAWDYICRTSVTKKQVLGTSVRFLEGMFLRNPLYAPPLDLQSWRLNL